MAKRHAAPVTEYQRNILPHDCRVMAHNVTEWCENGATTATYTGTCSLCNCPVRWVESI